MAFKSLVSEIAKTLSGMFNINDLDTTPTSDLNLD